MKTIYLFIMKIPEHMYYFSIYCLLSLLLILNGYAAIVTNDDWMLYNLLRASENYETLMMGYPLSYIIHTLYQMLSFMPWYSILVSSILLLCSYLIALYISKKDILVQKIILFASSLLLISFFWLHITITALSVLMMMISLGFVRKNIYYTLVFLFLSFMLRVGIVPILLPFWMIGFLLIRNPLYFTKKDLYAFLGFLVLVLATFFLQNIDSNYNKWQLFNQARASSSDIGMIDPNNILTQEEKFLMDAGWIQDEALLPTDKAIQANASPIKEIIKQLTSFNYLNFFHYKLSGWFYLLTLFSLLLMYQHRKDWRVILFPLFIIGIMFLIVIRDVDRVTIPLFIMWAFILTQSLEKHKILNTLFLSFFTLFFLYYASASFQYRYFKENTALKQEARKLIEKTKISSEIAMNFPTQITAEVITLMQVNYLFHENDWLKIDKNEILPNNWISRHPFFYETHQISHNGIKRKFENYHAFLLDKHTGFIGSKILQKGKGTTYLLQQYDKKYLSEKPECKHTIEIVAYSQNFSISQIKVRCR